MKKALLVTLLFFLVSTAGCSMSSTGAVSSAPASNSSSAGPANVASAANEASAESKASPAAASVAAPSPAVLPATAVLAVVTSTATRFVPPATVIPPATFAIADAASATPAAVVTNPTIDPQPSDPASNATPPDANAAKVVTTTPVFAFFFADWCGVCKLMRPSVDQLKVQYGDRIHFAYINVDDPEGKQAAATYRVWAIPFFVLLKPSGEIVSQWVGQQADTVFPTAFDDLLKSTGS
jgi:thioredoxin 1